MKRIVRLTENDLTRIIRRVIKENELESDNGIVQLNDKMIHLVGASEETVGEVLKNLSGSERYISIVDSGYADFTGINLCDFPDLDYLDLRGTENNVEEQEYNCMQRIGSFKKDSRMYNFYPYDVKLNAY